MELHVFGHGCFEDTSDNESDVYKMSYENNDVYVFKAGKGPILWRADGWCLHIYIMLSGQQVGSWSLDGYPIANGKHVIYFSESMEGLIYVSRPAGEQEPRAHMQPGVLVELMSLQVLSHVSQVSNLN